MKLWRWSSIFLYEEVCILIKMFFIGNNKAEKVINQPYFCSHIFHTAYVIVQIFFQWDFSVLDFVLHFSDLLILNFLSNCISFFSDGWFCAGPSPVYQHHHHSRAYTHIPSSPYDRLGIRSHRPAPYPNPYHKRTDLPTQGKSNF